MQHRKHLLTFLVVLGLGLSPAELWAQAAEGHDIVRLEDGARFRGTIAEQVPDSHVVIVLLTGETRRFEMSTVAYAGAESADPQAAPETPPSPPTEPPTPPTVDWGPESGQGAPASPAPPAAPEQFRVRIESEREGLTIYRLARSTEYSFSSFNTFGAYSLQANSYQQLCVAPCEAVLERGQHELVASRGGRPGNQMPMGLQGAAGPMGGGGQIPLGTVDVQGDRSVTIRHISRRNRRIAGWLVFGLGTAAGLAMSIAGLARTTEDPSCDFCSPEPDPNWALAGPGLGLFALSAAIGLAFGLQRDRTWLEQ